MNAREWRLRAPIVVALASLMLVAAARDLRAQVGLGARVSWARASQQPEDTSSTRFFGALFRARMSPRTAFELSYDWGSVESRAGTGTVRVVSHPLQTSLLLYPVRSTSVGVYMLGGIGWYWQRIEVTNVEGIGAGEGTRRFGYHAGLGGELAMGRHLAVHLDYRYTMIHAGDPPPGCTTCGGAIPIPGLGGLQDRLNLSHEASMWSTGLTFYF